MRRKIVSRLIILIAWLLTLYACRPVVAAQVPDAESGAYPTEWCVQYEPPGESPG